jgi:membrane carboxypeptidase/penicillin-binding protein
MPMPEGIVMVKIDRETGCPARAGQINTTFEVFRDGNVPKCDYVDDLPDIFNDAAGIDAPAEGEAEDTTDEAEDDEPLF